MSRAILKKSSLHPEKFAFGVVFTRDDVRIVLGDVGLPSDEASIDFFMKAHFHCFCQQEERMCEDGNEFLVNAVEKWKDAEAIGNGEKQNDGK